MLTVGSLLAWSGLANVSEDHPLHRQIYDAADA
jgi:hypothetical protein